MQENRDFTNIEDFLLDDFFVQWVLSPDKETISYWTKWMEQNPEKEIMLLKAKQSIKNLYAVDEQTIPNNLIEGTWEDINAVISEPKVIPIWRRSRFRAIAAALLLLIISISVFQLTSNNKNENVATAIPQKWLEMHNTTGQPQNIFLDDGSLVVLEPYSLLKYPDVFTGKQREVILEGEAFFDIERDTTKPFLVYANETITKVLGTSFRILAFEGDENVEVSVTSGKVAVYARVDSEKAKKTRPKQLIVQADEKILIPLPNKKLEVIPNQKVVFDKVEKKIKKTVQAKPNLVMPIEEIQKFQFDEAPIDEIFEALSEAYGLEIIYDKSRLEDCTLTTQLTDFPLFEKLKIISFALDLNFEEKNGRIYINGKGCK